MVKFLFKSVLILFLINTALLSQITDTIQQQNKQLDRVKKEIKELETELKNKSAKERESLQTLENLNKQKLLLSKLINNYKAEEDDINSQIDQTEKQIVQLEDKIVKLKKMYSDYVVWTYKNRGLSIWRFIFNAGSFNRALQRYKYFKLITEQNKKTLNQLVVNRNTLSGLKSKFENEVNEKEKLVKQKVGEQESLTQKETESKELVGKLKHDQTMIAEEIDSKRKAEIAIKSMIAKLVEEERERKSRLQEKRSAQRKSIPDYNYDKLSGFADLKGKLIWPVGRGKIVRKFGENKNERLKTITLNYGIDIEVDEGTKAVAVAEGIVSAIDWIPGYGSVLIITHKNEYRTVFGHIADLNVKEGDKVSAGTVLGRVNESLEGNILHFEIWNERNYQNPEVWLASK